MGFFFGGGCWRGSDPPRSLDAALSRSSVRTSALQNISAAKCKPLPAVANFMLSRSYSSCKPACASMVFSTTVELWRQMGSSVLLKVSGVQRRLCLRAARAGSRG